MRPLHEWTMYARYARLGRLCMYVRRTMETFPEAKGFVSCVEVKTQTNILERPITKLSSQRHVLTDHLTDPTD